MDVDTTYEGHPRLAQELLDFILDYLHYDLESLKRCALASKSLLPTSQRHLFSTYKFSKSNEERLVDLFMLPVSADGHDEDATLRARITDLLNTHTTDLILTNHPELTSGVSKSAAWKPHFPEFENVQRIVFRGSGLDPAATIPSFLERTWMSPSSRIRTVEFDFGLILEQDILQLLYILPATVENVSFTCARAGSTHSSWTPTSIRRGIEDRLLPVCSYLGVHRFDGTLKLRLSPGASHEKLLSAMLELGDMFKFNLKRINYRLSSRADIPHLASLVGECKNTLQSLDIMVLPFSERDVEVRSFDFSRHRALRSVRIWTIATFDPDWICAAISSIPKPSRETPRAPPLRIGLYITLPSWMMYSDAVELAPGQVDKVVTSWIAVDTHLSRLIGIGPDTPVTSVADVMTTGIALDISVPYLTKGPGRGVAALMFPLLSGVKGLVRLV